MTTKITTAAVQLTYTILSALALPFAIWRLAKRNKRANTDIGEVVRWREYFGFCPRPPQDDRTLIWIHAVSVGEAAAALPIAQNLQKTHRLMLTHTTTSGGTFWRRHFGSGSRNINNAGITISACPLDIPFAAKHFFRRCRPTLGIIMEAEYWHNLLTAASASGCKLILANARLNKTSARRYAKIAPIMRLCAAAFDSVCAQHKSDARRLRFFGAANIIVAGNIKYDRHFDDRAAQTGKQWRTLMPARPILLIAGTRPGEEALIIEAITKTNAADELSIIWAPRHPHRAAILAQMLTAHKIQHTRRSEGGKMGGFYIADTLGEMDSFYACCDMALICGSFLPFGGQNPIEAFQHNKAAVIGPYTENYHHIVKAASQSGALIQSANAEDAMAQCLSIASNARRRQQITTAAQRHYAENRGALKRTQTAITALLN